MVIDMTALTCTEYKDINDLRTNMSKLRNFKDIDTSLNQFTSTVGTMAIVLTILLVYPLVHYIYKNDATKNYNMFITMLLCLSVIALFIFGSFYGWITSILY